jgi:hypothetical protein
VIVLSLVQSLAWADEPSLVEWAKRRVDTGLVKPMVEKEDGRKKFSRSRPPPKERRVRVTRESTMLDSHGKAYVPFAIDVRFVSDEWQENDVTGCAYRESGALFVKIGDEYRPAAFLLGKSVKPVPGVCEPAPEARS